MKQIKEDGSHLTSLDGGNYISFASLGMVSLRPYSYSFTLGIAMITAATLTIFAAATPVASAVPWYVIGGIVGGELVIGLLYFLHVRRRARRVIPNDARFLIIRLSPGTKQEKGKEVFYVLSRGPVLRFAPRQDNKKLNDS